MADTLRLSPALIPRGHFHFLPFIYFQTVFSALSFSSDANIYFQIETPSLQCICHFQLLVVTIEIKREDTHISEQGYVQSEDCEKVESSIASLRPSQSDQHKVSSVSNVCLSSTKQFN